MSPAFTVPIRPFLLYSKVRFTSTHPQHEIPQAAKRGFLEICQGWRLTKMNISNRHLPAATNFHSLSRKAQLLETNTAEWLVKGISSSKLWPWIMSKKKTSAANPLMNEMKVMAKICHTTLVPLNVLSAIVKSKSVQHSKGAYLSESALQFPVLRRWALGAVNFGFRFCICPLR